jgi:hypothetical protein
MRLVKIAYRFLARGGDGTGVMLHDSAIMTRWCCRKYALSCRPR